jgi:hypothetical protein
MSVRDAVSASIEEIGGGRTSHHRDLVMQWCRTPHELVDLVVDGALIYPFDEGVEEESV